MGIIHEGHEGYEGVGVGMTEGRFAKRPSKLVD